MLQRLLNFINSERNRFETKQNNMFAFAFGEISIYYKYLKIINERYKKNSQNFINNTKSLQKAALPRDHQLSSTQMELLEKSHILSINLYLEIESFYLFSKILLDKMAYAIEFYFGQARSLSLVSHDKLVKHIEEYAKVKCLSLNQDLIKLVKKLKTDISDFRDHQISHVPYHRRARIIRAITYDIKENAKLLLSSLYPTEKDKQYETRLPQEISSDIETYIEKVIRFVEINKNKTKLKIKASE